MGTQSDFRVKKNLIVGDGIISSGDNANLVLRRDFDDTVYNEITLTDDTFKITLDNSHRLFIDGNGKVGIGVTTPDEILDVRSAGTPKLLVRTTASSSQEAHIIIGGARTTSTTADISRVIFNTYDADIGGSEGNTLAEITVRKQAASGDQGNLLFKTNSGNNTISEAMRIDKDGNVGIGTTSPDYALDIETDVSGHQANMRIKDTGSYNTWLELDGDANTNIAFSESGSLKWWAGMDASDNRYRMYANGGANEIFTIEHGTTDSRGTVGIANNAPKYPLDVAMGSSYNPAINIRGSTNTSYTQRATIGFNLADSTSTAQGFILGTGLGDDSDDFYLSDINGGGVRWYIDTDGKMGVGTTAPATNLHIADTGTTHITPLRLDNGIDTDGGRGVGMDFRVRFGSTNIHTSQIYFDFYGDKWTDSIGMNYVSGRSGSFSHHYFREQGGGVQMMIADDGQVGIGSSFTHAAQPDDLLHLKGTDAALLVEDAGSNSNPAVEIKNDAVHWKLQARGDDSDKFRIVEGTTTHVVVNTSGNVGIGATSPGYALDIQRPDAKINLKDTTDTDDMLVRFEGNDGNEYGVVGYEGSTVFKIESPQGRVINIGGHANVKVGVTTADMTFTPSALFHVNGALKATTKSFDIEHPTKEGMRLHHGVLEGPEHGVYIRGHQVGDTIELPDYWLGLVDEDTITVQLTAKGRSQNLYVKSVDREKVVVAGFTVKSPDFYYFIQAERKDVDKMEVEYGSVD